ncbi:MAG: 4-hydroxy-3-methylbut-2-enyl diphosphate reductase [Rickettsiales bacterium]|nr:4-hydroxy-3-methylbut-2-enyl diphosphate reductase [Rickettsiales bacterium]
MMNNEPVTLLLAQPRGFCAGVVRAIDIVEEALRLYGAPVYVRHEIVHNKWVVEDLKSKGVIFVKELDLIPDNAITVFSAHGIARKVELEAERRNMPAIDATCPLVTKVHYQARRYEAEGHTLILIGHEGHPEVVGTMGRVDKPMHLVDTVEAVAKLDIPEGTPLSFVTQTTLSVDDTAGIVTALRKRYPHIDGPDVEDICYATQNRQNSVKEMVGSVDLLLVIGAANSSNSNRLRDLGEEMGIPSHLINDASECKNEWLESPKMIGLTAGASAPEILMDELIEHIKSKRPATVQLQKGEAETMTFNLPKQVRSKLPEFPDNRANA